jgi:general L-amino acid transport system permease protein
VAVQGVKRRRVPWRDLVYQAALLGFVALVIGGMAWNAADALQRQNIASGFGFLNNTAGFDVVQTLVAYDETSTYGRVLLVGILNTLLVAVIGVVLATFLGLAVGIGQISSNWLVARLCRAYVEIMRNVPLLLQLFFWYFAVLRALPGTRDSWSFMDTVFLNNRGLYLPRPLSEPGFEVVIVAFAVGLIAAAVYAHLQQLKRERTGRAGPIGRHGMALALAPAVMAAAIMQFPVSFSWPELAGFDFEGGFTILPELIALVVALSTYTSGYIAEIVRAGIQGVPRGQVEASGALGLTKSQALKLVIVPQALRQIIPPLTSQYLNLTKNSSLAVAIAYPDLVSVFAGTTLNQTGQAIEIIAITMGVYLTFSLLTSAAMNWYNSRIALTER